MSQRLMYCPRMGECWAWYAGLSGGFQLASCDGTPDVPNIDGVEDVTEERRSLVRHATRIFDLVRGDALPRAASRALILEAAEQWKTG